MERTYLSSVWISLRPKTLTASLSPLLLAGALVKELHRGHLIDLGLIFLCTILMQSGANLTNDYYDAKRGVDVNRIGQLRAVQLGTLSLLQIKKLFIFCFALAFFIGLFLTWMKGWEVLLLGVLCLLVAWLYTGGPYPLSHWMLGEFSAFIFFGPVAVLGTLWVVQGFFQGSDLFLSFLPGSMAALMMGLNNQRDFKTDRQAGKRTPASLWGESFGRFLNLFFLLLTVVLPFFYFIFFDLSPWVLSVWIPFLLFSSHWTGLVKGAKGRELECILGASGKYFLVYHLFLSFGLRT